MASANSWTPAPGRHKVNIGSSLGRALKARKGTAPPQKRSNLPDRDFYSLRYNFKPSSVDSTKSGTIDVTRNKDASQSSVVVEHPSTQPNEVHVYKGREEPAKEWACVLIFDEETGSYTLEKIESFIPLEYSEKRAATLSAQPSPSPIPATPIPPRNDYPDDDGFEEILPEELVSRQPKTEIKPPPKENDDSEEDIPIAREVSPRKPVPTPASQRSAKASSSRPRPEPTPAPPRPASSTKLALPSSSTNKSSKKGTRRPTPDLSDGEEPIKVDKPPKRSRISPPPPQKAPKRAPQRKPSPPPPPPRQPAALELPGASSFIPPPPPSSSLSRHPLPIAPPATATNPPNPPELVPSDSEEDEWDEVAAPQQQEPSPPQQPSLNITMIEETGEEIEGGEEIDVEELENMLELHLAEEGDGEGEGGGDQGQEDDIFGAFPESPLPVSPLPVPPRAGTGPISLNQFAGGTDLDEEDDYSSSEESDED